MSDTPALKPYWGKPAVRNFREGNGNVGIMRSPLRAIALPDQSTENDPKSTCSIIIEVRVYLNIVTKFCCRRSDFRVQNGGGFSG